MYCTPHRCCCDCQHHCQPPGSGFGVVLALIGAIVIALLLMEEAESPRATSPPTVQSLAIENPR